MIRARLCSFFVPFLLKCKINLHNPNLCCTFAAQNCRGNYVHVTHGGCQSVFELIMLDGELVDIRIREKAGEEPLSAKDQKTAEAFIRKYYPNIISKWIKFFVLKQAVKSTTIKTKL